MKKRNLLFVLLSSAVFLASCGQTTPSETPHEHDWSNTWSTDNDYHWHNCNGCDEVIDKAAHNFDNGVVINNETCCEEGTKLFTCLTCGFTKEGKIDPHGHIEMNDESKNMPATYYSDGWEGATYCDECGNTINTGHAVDRKSFDSEVRDLENPSNENLKSGVASKIKQFDQCSDLHSEGGEFRYVTAMQNESSVEALYFSRLSENWDFDLDGENNYGFSETRFQLDKTLEVLSISFDYRLVNLNDDVCTNLPIDDKSYGFTSFVEKKTASGKYVNMCPKTQAPNVLVNDAEWHTYKGELDSELIDTFSVKIYHFFGELLIANIQVEYKATLENMYASKALASTMFTSTGGCTAVDQTNKSITMDCGFVESQPVKNSEDEIIGYSNSSYLAFTNKLVRNIMEGENKLVSFHIDVVSKSQDNPCARYAIVSEKCTDWKVNYFESEFDPSKGFDIVIDFSVYDLLATPDVYLNMTFRKTGSAFDDAPVVATISNIQLLGKATLPLTVKTGTTVYSINGVNHIYNSTATDTCYISADEVNNMLSQGVQGIKVDMTLDRENFDTKDGDEIVIYNGQGYIEKYASEVKDVTINLVANNKISFWTQCAHYGANRHMTISNVRLITKEVLAKESLDTILTGGQSHFWGLIHHNGWVSEDYTNGIVTIAPNAMFQPDFVNNMIICGYTKATMKVKFTSIENGYVANRLFFTLGVLDGDYTDYYDAETYDQAWKVNYQEWANEDGVEQEITMNFDKIVEPKGGVFPSNLYVRLFARQMDGNTIVKEVKCNITFSSISFSK